jgi:hypothetical protein
MNDDAIVVRMDARCYSHGMAPCARRPATYEDLGAVPEHLVAEIIDGELYTSPRPAPRHALAASRLLGLLQGPFDLGRAGPAAGGSPSNSSCTSADALVPDIAARLRA